MSDVNLEGLIKIQDQFSAVFEKFNQTADKLIEKQNKLDAGNKSNASSSQSASLGFSAYTATLLAVGAAAYTAVKAFDEKNRQMKMTEGLLKATNYSAGMTKKELYGLADALEDLTGIDGDEILGGENTLLTFKKIGKEVFPDATKAMVDLAAKMGGDVQGAAKVLGKALNNPIEASAALKRAGIDLSVAQEKQIATFQKNGQLAEAQKVILDELKNTYGGLAAEVASPLDQIKVAFGDIFEVVGELLFPTLKDFVNAVLIPMVTWIKANKEAFFALVTAVSSLVLVFMGPAGIIAAIAILGTALYTLRGKFEEVMVSVGIVVIKAVKEWISTLESFWSYLGITIVQKATGPMLKTLNDWEKTLEKKKSEIEIANKALEEKKKKEEEDEKRKAAAGGKAGKKKAIKDSTDDANKDKIKEQEDEVKAWEKTYGELDDNLKNHLRNEKKTKQVAARADLELRVATEQRHADIRKSVADKMAAADKKGTNKESAEYKKELKKRQDWAIDASDQELEEKAAQEKKTNDIINGYGTARVDAAKGVLDNLSVLQQSKSREAFEVGKGAAIANATIAMWQSATNSYNSLSGIPIVGPALGFAAAAAAVGAGMTQIQAIESQEFGYETGGIVGGSSFTGDKIPIRVNSAEKISTVDEQKDTKDIANFVRNQKSGGASSIYEDNRRIVIQFRGNTKEQRQMLEDVLKDQKRKKDRRDQNNRGRR